MKKILFLVASALVYLTAYAQPQLTKDNIGDIVKAMTLQEKVTVLVGGSRAINIDGVPSGTTNVVPGAAGVTRAVPRLGIPQTVLADGPAGVRISPTRKDDPNTYYATGFPVGTLLASSWDVDIVNEVTEAMGNEALEYGVDVLLAPGMNIHRNPLCGRNFEYFSEDPYLSGKIAAAYVNGIQSNGVGVSVKHFIANNQETNRSRNDSRISQRALREIYLKNFEIAIKDAKPWTVMSSYNQVNGEYTQQSYDLLTTILRDEWGFDGIVMTDWGSKENTVKSAKAGNDLMEPGNQREMERIIAAVNDGTISMEELDRNVCRMLEYIVRTPRFAGYKYDNKPDLKAHAAVGRKAAAESMILLKNENNTLPLAGNEKVALYGVTSVDFVAGGTGSGNVNKAYVVNMQQALEAAGFTLDQKLVDFYKNYVDYTTSVRALTSNVASTAFNRYKISEAAVPETAIAKEAKENDLAIVVFGRSAGEGGDRKITDDYDLTQVERELLKNVSNAYHMEGKKVVVVLNICGAIETASWKGMTDAILLPWAPGQDGAHAIADVLTGKVNPSGKLPMTLPIEFTDHLSSFNFPYNYNRQAATSNNTPVKNVDYTNYGEGIYVGYRHFSTNNVEVSYPFGYGLSYTTFEYSKPVVKATANGFTATVTVRNTGKVAGKEVVELYVSAPAGGLDKPACELKAFAKTKLLQPGEEQTLTMNVDNYSLASFNESTSSWEAAAGTYKVGFAANVEDIILNGEYRLKKAQSWKVNNVLAPLEF